MKRAKKPGGAKVIQFLSNFLNYFNNSFLVLASIFRKSYRSFFRMSKIDRILFLILFSLLILLIGFKGYQIYDNLTLTVPTGGGIYKEILVGEVKYLNPILARSDAERSISKLIYSGLVKINQRGDVVADLAESWEVSEDGKNYRFYLNDGIYFHDGSELSSEDALATFSAIKDPQIKSPYYEMWSEVEVDSPEEGVVEFNLPYPYGSFIYNCTQGVAKSGDIAVSLVEINNGTGPYKFRSIEKANSNSYTRAILEINDNYFSVMPKIKELIFDSYFQNQITALKKDAPNYIAVSGYDFDQTDYLSFDFQLGRNLILFPNLNNPFLADQSNRIKLFSYQKFEDKVELKIVALDSDIHRQKFDQIKESLFDTNVEVTADFLSIAKFQEAIEKRNYDLLLYGCDHGYEQDLYAFWHSSQVGKNNFSGYSDKESDIFLEDTRMMQDATERGKRIKEFCQKIEDQSLALIFPNERYLFRVNSKLKGIEEIKGKKPEDRFNGIFEWYLKERKIRK